MAIVQKPWTIVGRSRSVLLISLFLPIICPSAKGQAAAEAAGATSVSATPASSSKRLSFPSTSAPQSKDKSAHLNVSVAPSPDAANRQALEQRAGPDAGKLLLRSVPTGAQVWVDGALVGNTPILLIVAPGKYRVEMRGQRLEHAERAVALLPHETVELALPLVPRYPTRASVR